MRVSKGLARPANAHEPSIANKEVQSLNEKSKVDEAAEWAREKMHASAEKLAEIAEREEVREAKAKFLDEWNNIKVWCCANWQVGKYGRFRVIAVAVLVVLALKGLLGGWGGESDELESQRKIAEMQKETAEMQAGAALMGALLSGGGGGGGSTSSSSAPRSESTMNLWTCSQCGRQIESTGRPSGIKCPAFPNDRSGRDRCSFRLTR